MMKIDERRCSVLVTSQQALLGEVTTNLRAVSVKSYDSSSLHLVAFFDSTLNEQDKEAMALVETELLAAFPENHHLVFEVKVWPEPKLIPKDHIWIYCRKEPLLS